MLAVKVVFAFLLSACLLNGIYGYSVSGNKILDANGNQVLLRGVDRCSFEWNPAGEDASLADYTLMKNWGANVVRLSTNQDFWLSGAATHNAAYQTTIKQQVTWIKSLGMGVIIDLHWSDQGNLAISAAAQQNMADSNSITFWTQVATAYANDPSVIFELYNEPHDVSWSVWLNGGTASSSGTGYAVAGMQQLYNAVRATGANNVVVVGGLNYAYDLSGVASNPVVGTNIAYATHPYDYSGKDSSTWDASFGYLTATHPVIATEFGQYCNTDSYVSTLLTYLTNKGIHWTAWAWYVSGCSFPSLISDWSGTPLAPAGTLVKAALAQSATVSSGATTASATTKSATTAATTAAATTAKATTAAATTAKATTSTTTTGSAGGTAATISVIVNANTNSWWVGINTPLTGALPIQSISVKGTGGSYVAGVVVSYGYTFSPPAQFVAPLTVEIVSTTGKTAILNNLITTVTGGGTYTAATTYN